MKNIALTVLMLAFANLAFSANMQDIDLVYEALESELAFVAVSASEINCAKLAETLPRSEKLLPHLSELDRASLETAMSRAKTECAESSS